MDKIYFKVHVCIDPEKMYNVHKFRPNCLNKEPVMSV